MTIRDQTEDVLAEVPQGLQGAGHGDAREQVDGGRAAHVDQRIGEVEPCLGQAVVATHPVEPPADAPGERRATLDTLRQRAFVSRAQKRAEDGAKPRQWHGDKSGSAGCRSAIVRNGELGERPEKRDSGG
ncbi:MAG: hypothetical protein M3Z29_05945 [Pseudomonadota bacterium]|nr:hypothetical protein [Pseudomonadota bacterium]